MRTNRPLVSMPKTFQSTWLHYLTVTAAIITTVAVSAAPSVGKRSLRSTDVHSEDFPTVQAVIFMGQIIERRTANRLGVRVFHSGLLGDEGPLLNLVKTGKLDMTRVSAQALDTDAPLIRVLSLPYLFRDIVHLHKVLDGPIGQEILDSLRAKNLVGLAYYDSGIRNVYTTRAPINTLEDMRNLVIRVQPSALAPHIFELMHAQPVPLPFVQIGRALRNHIVEAAENNTPSYSSEEHYKAAPYYSLTRHSMTPDVLVMSRRVWDTLSASEQNIVRQAARESVSMMRDMWAQREERVEASLKLAGIKFNEIPQNELARFADAVQPIYAKYASDAAQQALIAKIRAVR